MDIKSSLQLLKYKLSIMKYVCVVVIISSTSNGSNLFWFQRLIKFSDAAKACLFSKRLNIQQKNFHKIKYIYIYVYFYKKLGPDRTAAENDKIYQNREQKHVFIARMNTHLYLWEQIVGNSEKGNKLTRGCDIFSIIRKSCRL